MQEAEPQRRDLAMVQCELGFSPGIPLAADVRLRSWLAGSYEGFDEASLPQGDYVAPAMLVTPLVVMVTDQPWLPPVFVNGPNGAYTHVEAPCAPFITVYLAPLGAYRLLGPAVSEIGGSFVWLDDIVGADARRLGERARAARTWQERGRLLDDFLLDRATLGPQPSPEVRHAWQLLVRSSGTTMIKDIARQVGWSHKHLITKFRQQVGVAPHLAARLLRLSTVWRHIDDDQTWARIAAESGYADQAHLIREFRQFTGTTPGALATA